MASVEIIIGNAAKNHIAIKKIGFDEIAMNGSVMV